MPNAPRPHCPGLTLQAPSLSLWGPKLEGRAHCPLPGAWSFLSAPSPSSHPGLLAHPCPCKPFRLLKASAGVHRAGTGSLSLTSLHTLHKCPSHWLLEENRKLSDHSCCRVARGLEKSQKFGFLCGVSQFKTTDNDFTILNALCGLQSKDVRRQNLFSGPLVRHF